MEIPKERKSKFSTVVIVVVGIAMLVMGSFLGYWAGYTSNLTRVNYLQDQLSEVQEEINSLQTEIETAVQSQTEILEEIDALQTQLLAIRSQIDSLQNSNDSSQSISQINAEIISLQNRLTSLQQKISSLSSAANVTYENVTVVFGETVLSQLFEQVRESVVVIEATVRQTVFGRTVLVTVQGSGFASNVTGQMTIITCNHVVSSAVSINVTFSNGNKYTAALKGANANTDVAVLTTNAPQGEYKPLLIVSSSKLRVGDPVIVIGTPYGLEGSMSNGIVSATNRTISVDEQTTMTNMIQTTAPLNPGNSGGPLMDYQGQVIGMADAIIQESQGIGLAVPSNTILQDILEIMS
jgi:S1-C subfamily serine protease